MVWFKEVTTHDKESVVIIPSDNIFNIKRPPVEFINRGVNIVKLQAEYPEATIYKLPIIGAYTETNSQLKD